MIRLFSLLFKISTQQQQPALSKISDWAFQWKTNFNPDPNKQAQEVIFSRKVNKINHSPLLFNQNLVKLSSSQKHRNGIKHQIRL